MKQSHKPLWIMFGIGVVDGALVPLLSNYPLWARYELIAMVVANVMCLYAWCRYDGQEHGFRPRLAAVLVVLLAVVGVPYYFLRSRPFGRACVAMLKALLYLIGVLLAYVIAALLSYLLLTRGFGIAINPAAFA